MSSVKNLKIKRTNRFFVKIAEKIKLGNLRKEIKEFRNDAEK
jgi:hypothetical protein